MFSITDIQILIAQKKCFALFRLPNETEVRLCMQNDGRFSEIRKISEMPQSEMFVFAPFAISNKFPIISIKSDICEVVSLENVNNCGKLTFGNTVADKNKYAAVFEKFHEKLNDKHQQKLVLSRKKTAKISNDFSPLNLFCKALERYKNSFVYLFYTPTTGFWCGSTMEVLLSGENGRYSTMSVAGTQKKKDDENAVWDAKNIREQALVSNFIRDVLLKENCAFTESKPYTTQAGNLLHLRTDFSFNTNDNILHLIDSLHPTPAICGIPQQESQQFIIENEGYSREYYAGFLGQISPKKCNLFVNLRCAKIIDNEISFFAGGGILPQSTMESEWNETEAKMETISKCAN